MGQEFNHAIGQNQTTILLAVNFCLLLHDAKAQFIVCRVKVHDQTALQARFYAFFKIFNLTRRAVCRNDDLFVLVNQRVEGVEEFFLRRILAGNELHIIDHQHINRPEQFLEIHDLAFTQGLHKAVHELFCRQVQHAQMWLTLMNFMRNGMHKVGFAKANTAIQKQGVERHWPAFGHPPGGRIGQFIRFANNECIKREARIKGRAKNFVVPCAAGFCRAANRRFCRCFLWHGSRRG